MTEPCTDEHCPYPVCEGCIAFVDEAIEQIEMGTPPWWVEINPAVRDVIFKGDRGETLVAPTAHDAIEAIKDIFLLW